MTPESTPEVRRSPQLGASPVRIFLQWSGDADPADYPDAPPALSEVTWYSERVFEHDVEYVKADGLRALLKEWLEHDLQDSRAGEIIREVESFVYANTKLSDASSD
jgi:hypothetical protein